MSAWHGSLGIDWRFVLKSCNFLVNQAGGVFDQTRVIWTKYLKGFWLAAAWAWPKSGGCWLVAPGACIRTWRSGLGLAAAAKAVWPFTLASVSIYTQIITFSWFPINQYFGRFLIYISISCAASLVIVMSLHDLVKGVTTGQHTSSPLTYILWQLSTGLIHLGPNRH